MNTTSVKLLVEPAIARLPRPHAEDVIEDVFLTIERNEAGDGSRSTRDGGR